MYFLNSTCRSLLLVWKAFFSGPYITNFSRTKTSMGTPLDAMLLINWASGASMPRELPLTDQTPDSGVLGPTSLTWRLHEEQWLIMATARAFLMQAAHPKVAQGAADHSRYAKDSFSRVYGTMTAMQLLLFGTTKEARAIARRLNRIHYRTRGVLSESVGRYQAGETYNALEPSVLLWVHITGVDSMLTAYKTFVGPLSEAECEQYWQESCRYARLLGLTNATLPKSYIAVQQYIREALASGEIAIGQSAHLIAQTILSPTMPSFRKPLWNFVGLVAIGQLPADIRQAYGFPWTLRHRMAFHLLCHTSRFLRHLFPNVLGKSSVVDFARCRSQGKLSDAVQSCGFCQIP